MAAAEQSMRSRRFTELGSFRGGAVDRLMVIPGAVTDPDPMVAEAVTNLSRLP
jgi:hypothetical protein